MEIEGVNFNEDAVRQMKRKDFIEVHKVSFFLQYSIDEREQLLSGIYDKIKGVKPEQGAS